MSIVVVVVVGVVLVIVCSESWNTERGISSAEQAVSGETSSICVSILVVVVWNVVLSVSLSLSQRWNAY